MDQSNDEFHRLRYQNEKLMHFSIKVLGMFNYFFETSLKESSLFEDVKLLGDSFTKELTNLINLSPNMYQECYSEKNENEINGIHHSNNITLVNDYSVLPSPINSSFNKKFTSFLNQNLDQDTPRASTPNNQVNNQTQSKKRRFDGERDEVYSFAQIIESNHENHKKRKKGSFRNIGSSMIGCKTCGFTTDEENIRYHNCLHGNSTNKNSKSKPLYDKLCYCSMCNYVTTNHSDLRAHSETHVLKDDQIFYKEKETLNNHFRNEY